jgi:hypothetical protein
MPIPIGKNRDCLNVDLFSDLGAPALSLLILVLLPVLILKKFLSLEGKWLGFESPDGLECFLVERERPEKFRFSEAIVEGFDDEKI